MSDGSTVRWSRTKRDPGEGTETVTTVDLCPNDEGQIYIYATQLERFLAEAGYTPEAYEPEEVMPDETS